jgi:hypothetical protein
MPERLPSVRSGSIEPADEVAIVVHSRGFAPHPVARSEPCLPRQRQVGRLDLSRPARILTGCPAPHRASEKDASLRLLQPNHDTSTQYAARFPISPPFQPCRLSTTWPSGLRWTADVVPARACAFAGTRRSSGGASLDGEPPASASPQPTRETVGRAIVHRVIRARHDLGGASIESSFVPCFPTAAFSTARRACSFASDALLHDYPARSRLSPRPALAVAGLRLGNPLVKDGRSVETRTPSLDECSLLRSGASPALGLRLTLAASGLASRLCLPASTSACAATDAGNAGSRRARHRTRDFAAASRLRAPLSLRGPLEDEPRLVH